MSAAARTPPQMQRTRCAAACNRSHPQPHRGRRRHVSCRIWSRQPDAWDLLWEQEEAARRAQQASVAPESIAQRDASMRAAAERAAERAQADAMHAQLLERQQRRDALRDRCVGLGG